MKKAALALGFWTLALPCLADVIPTSYDRKAAADRETVQSRLESLGSAPAAAEDRVKRLTPEELAYFAARPDGVQSAGRLYWYEWLGGLALLGALTFIYFTATND